ncbi:MAG: glycosyltransferase, partial [Sarcina sp.]
IKNKKNILKNKKKLENLIEELEKSKEFDLLTTHLPYAHMLVRLTKFKDKFYYVIHTVYSRKFERFKFIRNLFLKFLYDKKKLITVSQGVKQELENYFNIQTENIRVIYNPINIDLINEKKKEEIFFEKKFVCFVGRLTKIKNIPKIIQMIRGIDINLVIVGTGEEFDSLKILIQKLNLMEQVIFVGWTDNPYKWMGRAEALISLSEYEAFPVNIIECLACNTKVIAYDCDYGPREILTGPLSKYLVSNYIEENLSSKFQKLLNINEEDYIKYVKKYDIEVISNQYLQMGDKYEDRIDD